MVDQPVVLLDVDGVLADFHLHTFDFMWDRFGVGINAQEFPKWDILSELDPAHRDEVAAKWASPGWCARIPVYPGAREGVAALREVARVYFVTAQLAHSPTWTWERTSWLQEHFGAQIEDVVFTLSKYLVRGDLLVDDKPEHVTSWGAAHPEKVAILWERPWNTNAVVPHRASRWDEVVRQIRSGRG